MMKVHAGARIAARKPVGRAGYSIQLFHVTVAEANRVRRATGLLEIDSGR